ncbi:hypothetical protein L2E82_27849 [Cichorium intybus]|uniref:Uncharacterized protein n=1 Tax=Cichorium intybus TaxID=13427 RepID=A0ACB9CUA5_CICIN|nr:hypothetical protein L2E82_27849 [Cichorium intybus]
MTFWIPKFHKPSNPSKDFESSQHPRGKDRKTGLSLPICMPVPVYALSSLAHLSDLAVFSLNTSQRSLKQHNCASNLSFLLLFN